MLRYERLWMTDTTTTPPRLARALLLAALALSVFYLGALLWTDAQRLPLHHPFTGIEPQPVWGALRVARGLPLYTPWDRETPHVPLTYGPLAYLLPGSIARVFGRADADSVLHLGRALSALASLAVAWLLSRLARARGRSEAFAVLAALPLVWFPYPMEWSARFAPDTLALALSLGGLAAARRARGGLAGALWAAGALVKPTAFVGPLVALLDARRARSPGVLPRAVTVGAGLLVTSLLALELRTAGLWRSHLFDAMSVCAYSPRYALASVMNLGPAGVAALLALFGVALAAGDTDDRAALLSAACLELALACKQGSNVNYLLGTVALSALIAGDAWERAWRERRPLGWSAALAGVVTALGLGAPEAPRVLREGVIPLRREVRVIAARVAALPRDRVLSLSPYFGIAHDLPFLYADPYHANLLARRGRVRFDDALARLRDGRYDAVVSDLPHHAPIVWHDGAYSPRELAAALQSRYALTVRGRLLLLWEPRPVGR